MEGPERWSWRDGRGSGAATTALTVYIGLIGVYLGVFKVGICNTIYGAFVRLLAKYYGQNKLN